MKTSKMAMVAVALFAMFISLAAWAYVLLAGGKGATSGGDGGKDVDGGGGDSSGNGDGGGEDPEPKPAPDDGKMGGDQEKGGGGDEDPEDPGDGNGDGEGEGDGNGEDDEDQGDGQGLDDFGTYCEDLTEYTHDQKATFDAQLQVAVADALLNQDGDRWDYAGREWLRGDMDIVDWLSASALQGALIAMGVPMSLPFGDTCNFGETTRGADLFAGWETAYKAFAEALG